MGVQIKSNTKTTAMGKSVIYKLSDPTGKVVRLYEVPSQNIGTFQEEISSEKNRLEKEYGCDLSLVRIEQII